MPLVKKRFTQPYLPSLPLWVPLHEACRFPAVQDRLTLQLVAEVNVFQFEPRPFVMPGAETASGDWSEKSRREIASVRTLYPELAHWGELALGGAFGDFSQDVLLVNWAEWMLERRDEMFLDYCCWRQTRGAWTFGWDDGALAEGHVWKDPSTDSVG